MEGFSHYSMGPSHCCDLLAYMNEQRQLGIENVCDVRFVMGDKTIYAHRSVLAVCSSYFEGMLSGAFSESQGEGGTNSKMMEIDLSGSMCTGEDLDVLLTAIYIGAVKLSKQNVMGVTELACFLLVDCVREVCERFLMENLDIECCLQSLRVAHRYDLTFLFKSCRQIVQGRFHDHFIHQQDMLLTPPSCLKDLTKIYRYVRFHDLIQFLTRWVDHSWSIGSEGCEKAERAGRLTVACEVVSSVLSELKNNTQHLHQVWRNKLEGSADVIDKLLSQAEGKPFVLKCESSSPLDSASSHAQFPRSEDTDSSTGGSSCPESTQLNCGHFLPGEDLGDVGTGSSNVVGTSKKDSRSCSVAESKGATAGDVTDSSAFGNTGTLPDINGETNEDQEKESTSSTAKLKTQRESETEGRNDEDEEKVIADSGNGSFSHGPSTSCDTHTIGRETVAGSNHSAYQSGSGSCSIGDSDGSVHFSQNRAVLSMSDSKPDISALTDTGMKSSPGERDLTQTSLKRPFADLSHSASSCGQQMKKTKLETLSDLTDVVVAFVPDKKAVKYFTATECERHRPRHCQLDLHMCVYHIWQKQWLYAGIARFPEKFEDRDSWRMTCANGTAYFISVNRRKLHALELKTMTWSQVDCQHLFTMNPSTCKVRSMLPVAVDNKLYILASDKQLQAMEGEGTEVYITTTYYSVLQENKEWQRVTSVRHSHTGTPITLCNVSGKKVYVVKATIPLNLEKSIVHVEESHIFDSETEIAESVFGENYSASPLRLLVRNGQMHTVDGNSMHSRLLRDQAMWNILGEVDLTDIKIGRAACAESYLPCVSHSSTVMGSSAWEFSTSSHHRSALTELRLNKKGDIFTVRHTPPPFYFMTITAACQLSSQFVAALETCHFLHAERED